MFERMGIVFLCKEGLYIYKYVNKQMYLNSINDIKR